MTPRGLVLHTSVQKYLSNTSGLELVDILSGIPLFKDTKNDYFLGGQKSFYTIVPDASIESVRAVIDTARKRAINIQARISVPFVLRGAHLVNYVLDCRRITNVEGRYEIYGKKTRNLVKKSYKNMFRTTIGQTPSGFYDLYYSSMRRLGGIAKDPSWFTTLESQVGEQVVVVSLFDGDRLVAANYCIRADDYLFLMFNVSDPTYWAFSVNDRVYDELVAWAVAQGISYLDFGPSTASDDSHGHFKRGFGAEKWSIVTERRGTVQHKLLAFIAEKKHNLRIRFRKYFK